MSSWHAAQLPQGAPQRRRAPHLSTSEIMTILIHFHQSHYRNFKRYYQHYVLRHLRAEFPHLVSYKSMWFIACRAAPRMLSRSSLMLLSNRNK
jgi:hypothetical protein